MVHKHKGFFIRSGQFQDSLAIWTKTDRLKKSDKLLQPHLSTKTKAKPEKLISLKRNNRYMFAFDNWKKLLHPATAHQY